MHPTDEVHGGVFFEFVVRVAGTYWAPVNVNVKVDERPWKVLPALVGNVIVINSRSVVEIAVAVRFDNVRFVPMTAREARTVVVVPPQV